MKRTMFAVAAIAAIMIPELSMAEPPAKVPIQAHLTDDTGQPIDSEVEVQISLYDKKDGGEALHSETFQTTPDSGSFTVYLGANKALDLAMFTDNKELYVGVKVGDDSEMTPRIELATAPYAAAANHALTANTLQGKAPSDFAASDYQPNWSDIQNKPSGSCASGKVAVGINMDGTPKCSSLDGSQIADNSVGQAQLKENSVGSDEVKSQSLKTWDIANDAVEHEEIEDGHVRSQEIKDGEVKSAELADKSVGQAQLKENSVGSDEVKSQSLKTWDIASDAVEHEEIEDGAVRSQEIKNGQVKKKDMWWYGNCGEYVIPNKMHIEKTKLSLTVATVHFGIFTEKEAGKLPKCPKAAPGSYCETDGKCSGLGNRINNVGGRDVAYRIK